ACAGSARRARPAATRRRATIAVRSRGARRGGRILRAGAAALRFCDGRRDASRTAVSSAGSASNGDHESEVTRKVHVLCHDEPHGTLTISVEATAVLRKRTVASRVL